MSYARRPPDSWYIYNDGKAYCFNGADTLEEEPVFYRIPASAIDLLVKRMKRRASRRSTKPATSKEGQR